MGFSSFRGENKIKNVARERKDHGMMGYTVREMC
jgi:hypothetical protein